MVVGGEWFEFEAGSQRANITNTAERQYKMNLIRDRNV